MSVDKVNQQYLRVNVVRCLSFLIILTQFLKQIHMEIAV